MSALRQSDLSSQYYYPSPQEYISSQEQRATESYHQPSINTPERQVRKLVKSDNFRQKNRLPQNLQLLSWLQKSSFGLALVSMAASTGLYMATVQIPKIWSQEYRNLENLQRQERQLIAINETIKYQIAREASQDDRLSISKPDSAVFIPPTKFKNRDLWQVAQNNLETKALSDRNLGY